jgi:hypothetical protein
VTQLFCAIPSCRVPGEHRPDCDGDCRYGCQPRLTEDGYACSSCVGYQHQLLGVIADLAPDARAVAAGQVRRGPSAGGGGKPGSRPPLDAGATDALDEITTTLATITRHIAHTRGLRAPQSHADPHTHRDPLGTLCKWLSDQLEWVRHAVDDHGDPYAVTVHTAIRDAATRIRAIVNGPHARRYLGPCGANDTCDGDVYGRPGATNATCHTCGAQVPQDERRVWLDSEVRKGSFRAIEIEDAYGVKANLIRQWATPARNLIQIHDHDQQGRARYLLSQVLDVAARQAAKRAANEAKRAIRHGQEDVA